MGLPCGTQRRTKGNEIMAYVTRCPYCGSVWRLPNKETAEGAPVKCSKCRNFFDATRDLLCVPDELFPEIAEENEEKVAMTAPVAPQVAPQKPIVAATPAFQPAAPQASIVAPVITAPTADVTPAAAVSLEPTFAPSQEKILSEACPAVKKDSESVEEPEANVDPLFAAPKAPVTPIRQGIALKSTDDAKEKLERLNSPMPDFSGRTEPTVGAPSASEETPLTEPKNSTESGIAVTQAVARKKQKRSYSGPLLVLALFLVILCVAALIFNQSVLAKFPKTKPVFEAVCTKITCPGFFLNNIEAFAVTKAQLTNAGTPGSYTLEVTIMNGSNIAQAMPHLSLQLIDENDAEITRQILAPADFLADPSIKSLGAGRSLSIHVNMRTNATPSRCIATPIYP